MAVSGAAVESGARVPEREGVIDNHRAQERMRGMISHLCVALAHSLKSEVMLMEIALLDFTVGAHL